MSELIHAVRINEEIKQVLDASRNINLVALNALLIARQAGKRSLGFAVVARQLRELSADIETAMGRLDGIISALVSDIAVALKGARLLASARRTRDAGAGERAGALESRLGERAASQEEAVERGWTQLGGSVRLALRLSDTGRALARNAKVEAAHGGDLAAVLTQVAGQIESAIEGIAERLRALSAQSQARNRK